MAGTRKPTDTDVKRTAPGEYVVTDGHGRTWEVSRINYGYGPEWVAREVNGGVLDPLPTLRDVLRELLEVVE